MPTFDFHDDLNDLPAMSGPDGLGALGLWTLCGSWTSSHGRTGYVPDHVVEQFASTDPDSVARLVQAGLWERDGEGYRMLRGPSSDPDAPLPLWRYSDGDIGNRLFAIDDTPNN